MEGIVKVEVKTINEDTKEEKIIGNLYSEEEVKTIIKQNMDNQKERMDYEINKMKEEFEKELRIKQETYNGIINTLQDDLNFYKNIIKSVLHIKE